ncbi:hypothetical protein EYW47_11060 [Paraburkholderia silviterrae]|uniref:Uncharacterized protein n=1 Tax=Paraburkholderia silviterrae TaxID=2528715 RepID=A0A4R5MBA5_9BURK|nr:hypothetical protein EYW47_11060 [Paraburkholderia silviterrae]
MAGVPSGTPVSFCAGTPTPSCVRPPQLALGAGSRTQQKEAASCAKRPLVPRKSTPTPPAIPRFCAMCSRF